VAFLFLRKNVFSLRAQQNELTAEKRALNDASSLRKHAKCNHRLTKRIGAYMNAEEALHQIYMRELDTKRQTTHNSKFDIFMSTGAYHLEFAVL
tara:strand:- start:64801 stop:65082 length:282 start_codon:yes stop_codon:yes gene_type:complete